MLDALSHYIAGRKGLLPLLGMLLVMCNLLLRLLLPHSWLGATDLLLHVGILISILGFLLARVL